jgi:hypothetical protein
MQVRERDWGCSSRKFSEKKTLRVSNLSFGLVRGSRKAVNFPNESEMLLLALVLVHRKDWPN